MTTTPLPPLKPGYLTSEFWGTMLVHALAVLATLLDLLHVRWAHGLSGSQAAVPLAAMLISAVLQGAYHNKRAAVKMDHAAHDAATAIATIQAGYRTYQPLITSASSTFSATSVGAPSAVAVSKFVADTQKVVNAWHGDMRDVPNPVVNAPVEAVTAPAADPGPETSAGDPAAL